MKTPSIEEPDTQLYPPFSQLNPSVKLLQNIYFVVVVLLLAELLISYIIFTQLLKK